MQETCTNCPVSTFAKDTKSLKCTDCPIGYSTYGKITASSCIQCATGEFYFGGACLVCDEGRYRKQNDDPTSCKYCEAGKFSDSKGAGTCNLCLPGRYQDVAGQQSCQKCAEETYRPEEEETQYWTMGITSQAITENLGVAVSQNEWNFEINSQDITETTGVTVTQGSATGILKNTLNGASTWVELTAAAGVTFDTKVDLVIGSTTVILANINKATNTIANIGTLQAALTGNTSLVVIETTTSVTFVSTADLIIGSSTVLLANINTATQSESVAGTLTTTLENEWTLAITSQEITENIGATVTQGLVTGKLKTKLSGPTTDLVITTESGDAFVTTTDILIGSTTVVLANINTATDTTKVIKAEVVRLAGSSCFDCAIGQTTNGGKGATSCIFCNAGRYGIGCKLCEIGTFGELTTNAPLSCHDCPSGFASNIKGAGLCSMCLPGQYQNIAGQSSCKKCLKERYRPEEKDILYFTLDIASQTIEENAGVAVTQNEWTLDIASQDITESAGVVVSQNEWMLAFSVQDIKESAGVIVTQGSATGTLKTALIGRSESVVITAAADNIFETTADLVMGDIEWTLTIASLYITESASVLVTQGSGSELVTGTLKTTLTGDTTSIVIKAVVGATFIATADLIIGSTTVAFASITSFSQTKSATTITSASINTATHSISSMGTLQSALPGATTNIVVTGAVGGTFVSSSDVVIGSDEWTLAITAQTVTESAGTLITQGSVTGTLKTTLFANECTLAVLNAPVITETSGVTVTQGTSTGTLKTTLSGGATSIVIETASGVTFLDNVDITVGTSTLVHANINSATNTVVIESVVIETKPGVVFHDNADIVIGTGVTILSENIASATKSKSAAIVAFKNVNTATNSVSNVGTLKTALTGTTTTVVVAAVGGVNFVTTTNLIIGSSTVLLANINAATESRPARLSASSCFDCPTGYTTNGGTGSSSCGICGAGKYGTGCKLCEVGTFRSTNATIESPLTCRDCPSGFFQVSSGQATCIPCSPGKAQSLNRSSECLFCPKRTTLSPGYYGKDSEMSECKECENGKQAVEDGSTFCSNCMAGTYGRHCSACVPGKYRSPTDYDSTQCIDCKSGYYQPETFQASCLPCSPGLFQSGEGAPSCDACAMGKFAHALKSDSCAPCELGKGTAKNGSAFCIDCARGQHAGVSEKGVCKNCLADTYSDVAGMKECAACLPGQMSPPGAPMCAAPATNTNLKPPSPPKIEVVEGRNDAIRLKWTHDGGGEIKPDGFYVRMGSSRDFKDGITVATIKDDKATSAVIQVEPGVALWLLKQTRYMQVSAYVAKDKSQSEWSTATEPWVLAHKCDDDEFLSTNHTTSPTDWKCDDCPFGASCLGPSVWDDVRPLQGYWRVSWNHSVFERCPYVDDCLGYDVSKRPDNQTSKSEDGCVAGTKGLVCSLCADGFNRDVAKCTQCTQESLPIRVGILVVVLIAVYVFMLFCKRKLRTTMRKYQSIRNDLLRIGSLVVTYSQINTSIPTMIDIPWPPEFVNFVAIFNVVNIDIFSLVGVSCVGAFNFYLSFLAMCAVPLVIALWALADFWSARKRMVEKIQHMTDNEKRMEEENALHNLYHISDLDGEGNIDSGELATVLRQLGWDVDAQGAHRLMEHFHDDGTKQWSDEFGHFVLTEEEFVRSMMGKKMSKLLKKQNVLRVGAKVHATTGEVIHSKESLKETMLCNRDHLIEWVQGKNLFANSLRMATALALLAHTPVSRKVFQFFHCNDIAGRFFLRADYSIECWSLEWWAFSPVVFVVLAIFTVGLPGMIGFYLYRHRKHLYSATILKKIGWLYDPFRRGREFWPLHDVALKMILTGLLIYVPATARASVAAMVGVFACCSLNMFYPHKSPVLFWLNQLSFISTTFKYLAALMLRVDHTKYSDGSEAMIGIMLIGLDLAFLVGSVLTFFIAAFVLRRRIIHIRSIKSKMRTLARTATTLDFGERNVDAAATSRELAEWKIPENQRTPEEKDEADRKKLSTKSTKVVPVPS